MAEPEVTDVAGVKVRLHVSDAVPPGTVVFWSPRACREWVEHEPVERPVHECEPVEQWARRCGVLRVGA